MLGLLALTRAKNIDFDMGEKRGWSQFNFKASIGYDLRAFENLKRSAILHPAVLVSSREEQCDEGMVATFLQAALYQCCRDGMDLFQISSFSEQYQLISSLRAKNRVGADSSGVLSGKERVSKVGKVEEADE